MIRSTCCAVLVVLLAGCYTLRPARGVEPEVGTAMAFDVNDIGRIALGGSMGPEIAQIEGRLIEKRDGEYLVAVSSVKLLRGGQQVWSGERVRLKPEHLGNSYERRFSRGRTIALGAVAVGGITAFLITRDLLVFGGRDDGGIPGDTIISLRVRP